MKEFNEYGEQIEQPKKKRRGLFSGYEKDGKGIAPFAGEENKGIEKTADKAVYRKICIQVPTTA